MDGAAVDVLGVRAQGAREPRGDLVGGLVGEGDGADAGRRQGRRREARGEVLDPPDQAERLAGAGARHDEHGPEWRLDRLALLRAGRLVHARNLARGAYFNSTRSHRGSPTATVCSSGLGTVPTNTAHRPLRSAECEAIADQPESPRVISIVTPIDVL